MIKHVALISLAVGLIMSRIVPLPFFREPPAYSLFTLDPVELARQKRLLAEQQKARNDFVEVREGILERLGQGKITLSDACDRIYFAAREIYPKYAGIICGNDKLDPKRYMACNVVERFRVDAEDTPSMSAIVQRLERELSSPAFRTWCEQAWKR
jgi:hypothetical protein